MAQSLLPVINWNQAICCIYKSRAPTHMLRTNNTDREDEYISLLTDETTFIKQHYIVGIGMSTGGLQSLEEFFRNVEHDCGWSFVIVNHSNLDYGAFLTRILSNYTHMAVLQAKDGERLNPDCIYIVPPGWGASVNQSNLILHKLENLNSYKPIDWFFCSLSKELGVNSVGIIMSGTGCDGKIGAKSILKAGGTVLVQNKGFSKFNELPGYVISSGYYDNILYPSEMPGRLVEILKNRNSDALPTMPVELNAGGMNSPTQILLKSDELYEKLVQNSPYAIILLDNGRINFCNREAMRLLDVEDLSAVSGKPLGDFIDFDEKKLLNDTHGNKENDFSDFVEHKIRRRDGSVVFIEMSLSPFYHDGLTSVLAIIRDITSTKYVENLQKDIEASNRLLNETLEYDNHKTEFFLNLSHELRTPLNVIIGTLQLFNKHLKEKTIEDSDNKIKRFNDIMQQNSYRLLRLVNNIIDLTSIDSGLLGLNLENRNIVQVVEEIVLSVKHFVERKGITLVFDTEIEDKQAVFDLEKIEKVILNLISNAIKYTGRGGCITVTVQDENDRLFIKVKDTGIGIERDKLAIIFDRFSQVEKSLTRDYEGSGIGLALAKALVEMHKGKLSVVSEIGKGSEFIVELPAGELNHDLCCTNLKMVKSIEKINIEFADISKS